MSNEHDEGKSFMPVDVGDFDSAAEAADKVLVPSQYSVSIKDWRHGQGPKAQYISWQLSTVNCPDPEDNDFPLFYSTPIEGRGQRMLVKFLQAVGQKWEGSQITPEFCDSLIGLELMIETSIENWEGADRARVKKVLAPVNAV
jgi:hypothetical protein